VRTDIGASGLMKVIQKYLGVLVLFLLYGSHSFISAGIRPSFDLATCSWNATDIVVVTEGKTIDGVFSVLESWKGDLAPGDRIKVPELAAFKPPSTRSVSDWWEEQTTNTSEALYVTGERMILLLKKDSSRPASEARISGQSAVAALQWKSSSIYDEMSVSVVWIEQGKPFGFVQVMNPGPSRLVSLGSSEDKLKGRVMEIKDIQDSFLQTIAIENPRKRAEALTPFVVHPLYLVRNAALQALKTSGKSALPVVRRMLADDSLLEIHSALVGVLAATGEGDAGLELTELVKKGLEFWRENGPILKKGWWNGEGFASWEDAVPLRNRYSEVYSAILELRARPYRESEAVLIQFREFWHSLPQLEEIGSNQITEACDEVLRELDRLKANDIAIRFEGLLTFDESDMLKALREERIMTEGSALSPEQIEKAQTTIKRLMTSQGYSHGTVVVRNEQLDPSLRALTFVVNQGDPIGVAEVRFTGNNVFSSSDLSARARKCLTSLASDGVNIYNTEELDYCLRQLDNFAKSKGYLRARFHDPESEETKDGLIIIVQADEGIRYRVGELTFNGAKVVPPDLIRSKLSLRSGDIACGEVIAKWLFEDLKKTYGEMGYIEYTAEAEPEFKAPVDGKKEGVVDFKITIEEGRQFKLQAIKFQGSNLPEKELLGLLRIRAGEVFNQRLFEESIDELNKLGHFEFIDKNRDADFRTDEEVALIDIVVKVRNKYHGLS
jgi:hypothetical protein